MVLEVKLDAVEDLEKIVREMVAAMVQTAGRQRWYNLKDACEYKGVTYGTVKCDSYRQPLGGRPDAFVTGRYRDGANAKAFIGIGVCSVEAKATGGDSANNERGPKESFCGGGGGGRK